MIARELWRVIEPYHQVAYRSPAAEATFAALGLDRAELRYIGGRLAALGPISAPVATAVLWGFAPRYAESAIPEVWHRAPAEQIVAARAAAASETLAQVLGAWASCSSTGELARLLRRAAESIDLAGRPLGAAQLGQPWPDEPHAVAWQACTVLREHRGDAHWAATAEADIDPVECHVLHAADGHMPAEMLQRITAWTDQEWAAAAERLRSRGLIDADGVSTDKGAALKKAVEDRTDELAARPWVDSEPEIVIELMRPAAVTLTEAGLIASWELRERLWKH